MQANLRLSAHMGPRTAGVAPRSCLFRGRVRSGVARASHRSSPEEQPCQHVRQHPEAPSVCSEPAETLRCYLEQTRRGNAHAMLEVLPDEVIDRALEQSRESGSLDELQLQDVISSSCNSSSTSSSPDDGLYLDTYALRNLLYAGPDSVQMLSGLHLTTDTYLQRCAIVAPSGEECVLTFTLRLQDSLESQYRGPPLLTKKWMLSRVVGECSSDELPAHPSPSFPPEAVVEAQLHSLREFKVASVFAHTSPDSKAVLGPVERFAALLHQHPAYTPLLGHTSATTVQRLQSNETTYMEVVRVQPRAVGGVAQAPLLYMFVVSRQGGSSNWQNCWMTDAVQLLDGPPGTQQQQQQWGRRGSGSGGGGGGGGGRKAA